LLSLPSNQKSYYTVIESEQDKTKGLYRSDDAGAAGSNSTMTSELLCAPFYFSRIEVDPKNPDVVVKAGLLGSISRDGGKTFKNLGPNHSDVHDIVFDIKILNRMYCSHRWRNLSFLDGGTTLEMWKTWPVCQFYHVSVDNEEPLQCNGACKIIVWMGPSSSPGGVEARDWQRVAAQADGYRVYPHLPRNSLL